jgi:hypothetical protein
MGNWSIGKSATLTDLAMCINEYRVRTVGSYACISVGVKIESQILYPDMIVMINYGRKKQCEPDYENDYFVGPPNFVLDIHENTNSQFIKARKKLFASSGVEEYLIVNESLSKIEWNRLENKKFKKIQPDKDGIIKSTSLPGLWIPINALKKRDNWTIMACIEHGLTRREHHELMHSIWNKN